MPSEPSTFPRSEPDLLTVPNDVRSGEYKAFLKYVAQSSGIISYEQLALLYPTICQAAMTWLLKEKKSVDFGFVILHPMPHRANWKQILLALFPTLGPSLLGKSRHMKHSILESTGCFTKLLSGELLAVASERLAVWGLELELKRSWWRAMFRLEQHNFNQLGSVDYASFIARQIVKLRPKIVGAYLSFLRQVAYPCARIQVSRSYKRGFIVPYVPRGKVKAISDQNVPVDIVVPRDSQELATPSLKHCISTAPGLPEVSDIRQNLENLRISKHK